MHSAYGIRKSEKSVRRWSFACNNGSLKDVSCDYELSIVNLVLSGAHYCSEKS